MAITALLPNSVVGLLLFVTPVVMILFYAVGTLDYATLEVQWGWSLSSLQAVFTEPYLTVLLQSLGLAAATVVACAIPGFAIAYVIAQSSGRARYIMLFLVIFPFWTSYIVRTYAWTNLLGEGGPVGFLTGLFGESVVLLGTVPGVLIGMVSAYLPMMVLPIYVALERVPKVLVEAARDLGAGEGRILRSVLLPGALPGLAAGALLVGIPACGEYVVPAVLGRGKVQLLGNLIGEEIQRNGNYPFGAALTASLLAALALVFLLVLIVRRISLRGESK